MRTIQLIITEDCNLDCVYCFEKQKTNRRMPTDMAIEIVDHYLDTDDDDIVIDFAGGEPLLAFKTIRSVVEHVEQRRHDDKRVAFDFTTNGTLLTLKIKKWLDDHPSVGFSLSIDGTPEAHNLNRCGTYEIISQHFPWVLSRRRPTSVKMTISTLTLSMIYDGITHIYSLGFPSVHANVPHEDLWGDNLDYYLKVFSQELDKLVSFFRRRTELDPPQLLNLPIHKIFEPHDSSMLFPRWCGAGTGMICYNHDGTRYPCHRFVPLTTTTNNLYEGPVELPQMTYEEARYLRSPCVECRLCPCCPSCCGNNWEVNHNADSRTTSHCPFIVLQVLATAKLQLLKLTDGARVDGITSDQLKRRRIAQAMNIVEEFESFCA